MVMQAPREWDEGLRRCPHCGGMTDLVTSDIYRARFSSGMQSGVTTIDSRERCLDWINRWSRFLVPRQELIVHPLVPVGSLFDIGLPP